MHNMFVRRWSVCSVCLSVLCGACGGLISAVWCVGPLWGLRWTDLCSVVSVGPLWGLRWTDLCSVVCRSSVGPAVDCSLQCGVSVLCGACGGLISAVWCLSVLCGACGGLISAVSYVGPLWGLRWTNLCSVVSVGPLWGLRWTDLCSVVCRSSVGPAVD